MSSRIVINGKVWYGARLPREADPDLAEDLRKQAEKPELLQPILPEDPRSLFRLGIPFHDTTDDVVYRVVGPRVFDSDDWAPLKFWCDRYFMRTETFFLLCRMGMVDAAIEEHSQARRYRVRDDAAVKAWVAAKRAEVEAEKAKKAAIWEAKGLGPAAAKARKEAAREKRLKRE